MSSGSAARSVIGSAPTWTGGPSRTCATPNVGAPTPGSGGSSSRPEDTSSSCASVGPIFTLEAAAIRSASGPLLMSTTTAAGRAGHVRRPQHRSIPLRQATRLDRSARALIRAALRRFLALPRLLQTPNVGSGMASRSGSKRRADPRKRPGSIGEERSRPVPLGASTNSQYNRLVRGVALPLASRFLPACGRRRKLSPATSSARSGEPRPGRRGTSKSSDSPTLPPESVAAEIGVGRANRVQVAPKVEMLTASTCRPGCSGRRSVRSTSTRTPGSGGSTADGPAHRSFEEPSTSSTPSTSSYTSISTRTWAYVRLMHADASKRRPSNDPRRESQGPARLGAVLASESVQCRRGLYWLCPEIVAIMADHAGFSVVAGSAPHPENEYSIATTSPCSSGNSRRRVLPRSAPGHAQEHARG